MQKKASENTGNVETKQYTTKQTSWSLEEIKGKIKKQKNKNLEANENYSKSIKLRKNKF